MSNIPEAIKGRIKDTVGYAESERKIDFINGANVAFSKSEDYYMPIIKQMQSQIDIWKKDFESVDKDMKTLVGILNKYSNQD